MLSRLSLVSAAFILAAPVLAASSGGPSSVSSASASRAGGAVSGGGHGAGAWGAHGAAESTHLGGAGHPLHPGTAHVVARQTDSKPFPKTNDAWKKSGNGPDHASHIFLHRGSTWSQREWAATCIRTFTPPDGAWADCNRPVKSSSGSHT